MSLPQRGKESAMSETNENRLHFLTLTEKRERDLGEKEKSHKQSLTGFFYYLVEDK